MKSEKCRKRSEILREVLRERSREGLELARRTMLMEEIGSEKIWQALKYYVSDWENFTYPALFSIACEAVGGNPKKAVNVQTAIALLIGALDIHDDIIDKSKVKRGKLTVFGKFGQEIALFLGNAFLINGFTLLSNSVANLPAKKAGEVVETIKKSMFEVGTAHTLELDIRGRIDVTPKEYMRILKMKAASAGASMRLGAVIGGGRDHEVKVLTRYGRILGLLATLRDEFIDIFEPQELSQRLRNECLPIPIFYALQGENSGRIKKVLAKKRITNKDAYELVDIVWESKEVKVLKKKMVLNIKNACILTSEIRNRDIKDLLTLLATSALEDL